MIFGARGHDFGVITPEELADRLVSHGLDTVQLAIHKSIEGINSYLDVTDALLSRIDKAFTSRGINISVLGCYIEPSLQDESRRAKQLEIFERGIYCAKALGAGCIGTETTRFTEDESLRPKVFDILCRSVERMLGDAAKSGVTVAVEPVSYHTLNTPELTAKLLKTFGKELRIIFDPVNLLTVQNADTQNQLWRECFDSFGWAIAAVHVKDAAIVDGKLAPVRIGGGVMDYETVIMPWLKQNKPDIALLREELKPEYAAQDIAAIKKMAGVG